MTETTGAPAAGSEAQPAEPQAAPPPRKLAPIPSPQRAAAEARERAAAAAAEQPRDESGRFTPDATEPGYESRELDPDTNRPINPHNFPKATLPGMESEELEKTRGIRVHRRRSMREQLAGAARAHLDPGDEQPASAPDGKTAPVTAQPAADAPAQQKTDKQADPNAHAPAPFTLRTHRDPKTNEWVEESWPSFEKFQDNYRSLRGMHRALDRRTAEAEQNAENWRAKAEAYENGTLQLPGRKPANGHATSAAPKGEPERGEQDDPASPRAPEEEYLEAVDWAKYNQILADPRHGDKAHLVAAAWLSQQAVRFAINKVNSQLEERDRPSREQAETLEAGRAIRAKVTEMSEWTNPDGSVFYPELQDGSTLREIAAAVDQLHKDGVPLTILRTEKGVHQAILLWRDWRNRTGRPWSPNGNGNGHAPAPAAQPNVPPAPPAGGNGVEQALADLSQHNAGVIGGRNAPYRPAPPGKPGDAIRKLITGPQEMHELGWPI